MIWIHYLTFSVCFWIGEARNIRWDRVKTGALPRGFPGIDSLIMRNYASATPTTLNLDSMWLEDFESEPEPTGTPIYNKKVRQNAVKILFSLLLIFYGLRK